MSIIMPRPRSLVRPLVRALQGVVESSGPAPFSPIDLGPVVLTGWWRGDLGLASLVYPVRWADQSAHATVLTQQGVNTNTPTYSAAGGPNGHPYWTFNGNGDASNGNCITNPAVMNSYITNAEYVIWQVMRVTAIINDYADGVVWNNDSVWCSNGGYAGLYMRLTGTALKSLNFDGNADVASTAGAPFALNTWMRVRQRHVGGQVGHQIGANAEVLIASGNTSNIATVLVVGNYRGSLAELIVTRGASAPQMAQVDAYLAARYGL